MLAGNVGGRYSNAPKELEGDFEYPLGTFFVTMHVVNKMNTPIDGGLVFDKPLT